MIVHVVAGVTGPAAGVIVGDVALSVSGTACDRR